MKSDKDDCCVSQQIVGLPPPSIPVDVQNKSHPVVVQDLSPPESLPHVENSTDSTMDTTQKGAANDNVTNKSDQL